nr:MAG: polymerase PA protein [Arthropod orthomyxo-like virus]
MLQRGNKQTSSDEYKVLWRDRTLYDEDFVKKFGINSPHWAFENDQKRELSLRHDYACALLCNMEKISQKRGIDEVDRVERYEMHDIGDPEEKKQKMDETLYQSDEDVLVIDDTDMNDFGSDNESIGSPQIQWVPPQDEKEGEVDDSYRFWMLEGNLHSAAIQNYYCEKFNHVKFTKIFDLVDTKLEKFVEVKISLNPSKRIREYTNDPNTDDRTALIVIHPEKFTVETVNYETSFPGEEKVIVFLTKRLTAMKKLGISDSDITEEVSLEKAVLSAPYLEKEILSFKNLCVEGTGLLEDADFCLDEEPNLQLIRPSELFDLLDDPSEFDGEEVIWKGVLSPPSDLLFQSTSGKDIETIKTFLCELSISEPVLLRGKEEHCTVLKEVVKMNIEEHATIDNFRFHKPTMKNQTQLPCLKEQLGIGRKKVKYNEGGKGMKQPEPKVIERRRYSVWFEETIKKLGDKHKFVGKTTNLLEVEKMCYLKIGSDLQAMVNGMINEIGSRMIGIMMSQYINLGSRISGSYLVGSRSRTSHAFIACVPLLATMYTLGSNEPFRIFSGICFRAPHHARNANDNINLLVIERIHPSEELTTTKFSNESIVKVGIMKYRIRQTAIKKSVAVHLTFLNNSIFNAMNLLGELVLNNKTMKNMDQLLKFTKEMVETDASRNYIIARVIESNLMAIVGNTRDEGYLAMSRKLFMIVMAWRRNKQAFTWDIKEFAEKVNECLIDNPLSMHFHMNFLYLIAQYGVLAGQLNL